VTETQQVPPSQLGGDFGVRTRGGRADRHAVNLSPSTWRSHPSRRFQLAKMRLTIRLACILPSDPFARSWQATGRSNALSEVECTRVEGHLSLTCAS
jgi:hypothetical protein